MIPAGAAALDLIESPEGETVEAVMHTLSVLVENKPGALARISNCSPAAASTSRASPSGRPSARRLPDHDAGRLRPALARADREADAQARQRPARQELEPGEAVERELALVKVAAPPDAAPS